MSDRRPLSKKVRFDIFKRDEFSCQYCGQKPPAVVLEVDHVIPVCEGGKNDEHNLLTSCFDCNRGKGSGSLQVIPIDLARKAELLREREEQVRAYDELLQAIRGRQEEAINGIIDIYTGFFPGWTLTDRVRPSIRQFLTKLPTSEVVEAMELACERTNSGRAFNYFCGVCWRKIKGDYDGPRS